MPEVVLSTLNAKYVHSSFGLRYLHANLGALRPHARIAEFDINQRPLDIVESLLALNPKVLGLGVYIWNARQTEEVVAALKRVRPDIVVVLGGPEISYETDEQPIARLADYIIQGEADIAFSRLCAELLQDKRPAGRVISAPPPTFAELTLPYDLYADQDVAHRLIYVEASRGCPFSCEFCLSSLDIPVRQAPLPAFLESLRRLLERGARQLKFVDRTFNLNPASSRQILEFLLGEWRPGRFFHFEMVPDLLPEELREIIARFPAGALQFEVGVQTFNEQAAALIHRRQKYERLEANFRFLRTTGVHIHADLIAGLPGEDVQSFGAGFDRLIALGPQEIQVGILKRLRGTPISRHDAEWGMVYNTHPPYEILRNRLIDFATMQALRRFARYWDLVGNSGNFVETAPRLWSAHESPDAISNPAGARSPFRGFLRWSEWLHHRVGRTDSIALLKLMELMFAYLTRELHHDERAVAQSLWRDYQRGGRQDKPGFLKDFLDDAPQPRQPAAAPAIPKRQARHLSRPG